MKYLIATVMGVGQLAMTAAIACGVVWLLRGDLSLVHVFGSMLITYVTWSWTDCVRATE